MVPFTPLERVAYRTGQLLSVADFQAEQDYFIARLQRHNRVLHGWGVVDGLEVATTPTTIVVAPGLAIDCVGNEIVVSAETTLVLPDGNDPRFVVIRYLETGVSPVPLPNDTGDATSDFTRIREGLSLALAMDDPVVTHAAKGPGTIGCGVDHGLCIAQLRRVRSGWRVALRGRRAR